jgi:D-glycerate 3-kinase
VTPPIDLVLLEGWMVGFEPASELSDERLRVSNAALVAYRAWTSCLDALVVFEMKDVEQVVQWRIETEQAARASGKPGLSDAEVEDYVRRFLPGYRTWRPSVPSVLELRVVLGPDRLPA